MEFESQTYCRDYQQNWPLDLKGSELVREENNFANVPPTYENALVYTLFLSFFISAFFFAPKEAKFLSKPKCIAFKLKEPIQLETGFLGWGNLDGYKKDGNGIYAIFSRLIF